MSMDGYIIFQNLGKLNMKQLRMPEGLKGNWSSDPLHSELNFVARHLMISDIRGEFENFDVDINIHPRLLQSEIKVKVDTNSISTKNKQRDDHLKSIDFLDVKNFPYMEFQSTSIECLQNRMFVINGVLEIKGICKEITLDLELGGVIVDPCGELKAGISVKGEINRKDWGMNWNLLLEGGGVVLGDEIRLCAELELVKTSPLDKRGVGPNVKVDL